VGRIWSRTKKWIRINDRSPSIGLEKSICLLFIVAFNGCDVVSAYHDKGEKTAWRTWNAWSEASTVFRKLSQYPPVLGKDDQSILEKLIFLVPPKTDHMNHPPPHTQHKQLSFNIISVLHTKQIAYGDKKLLHVYVKWKPKSLRTGVRRSKITCGKCFEQYFRQLLRVANSLRRVAARLNSVAGASALVFLA
jgi:hypothetical protein